MMAMESPLEVLSRAASVVETSDARRDGVLKRNMDQNRDNELPAKMFKYCHLPSSLRIGDEMEKDSEPINRRCAGTQTSFSSFSRDLYRTQRVPDYKILDLDQMNKTLASTSEKLMSPVNAHTVLPISTNNVSYNLKMMSPRNRSHPPPVGDDNPGHIEDCNHTPLNLTTSTGLSSPPSYQQQRPSVITIAPSSYSSPRSSTEMSPQRQNGVDSYKVTSGDGDVSSIDEHFRRSLGQTYPVVYGAVQTSPPTQPLASPARSWTPPSDSAVPHPPPAYQPCRNSTPPTTVEKSKGVSVDGTVDDHFAKSLGDKWKEINQPIELDVLTGSVDSRSVDDHFAKALGETWLRLKATKQGSISNPGSPHTAHN